VGKPHGIGVIGAGVISGAYLETLTGRDDVRVAAVADLDLARAEAVAAPIPGARALTVEGLLADGTVDTVLNLTVPAAHAEVALGAIAHGKGIYGEKPLAATLAEARAIVAAAETTGVAVGCAPDTVLGTGTQTARAAVEDGLIGRPISAIATWVAPGHELWHPNPDFYYLDGGGPLLDMGPYYISSLLQILGPVESVVGSASRTRDERVIGSGPRAGEVIPVETETHVTGILTHTSGVLSTITVSFDAVRTDANFIEIHGELGSLVVPDPNTFGGDVRLIQLGDENWRTLPPAAGYADGSRGIGLIDYVLTGSHRASGDLALHALETMTGILTSARERRFVDIESRPTIPPRVPLTPAVAWQDRG
jgi:predicted dehydrogenase